MKQRVRRAGKTAGVGLALIAATVPASIVAGEPAPTHTATCLIVENEPGPDLPVAGGDFMPATRRMNNLAAYMLGMVGAKCQSHESGETVTLIERPDGTTDMTYVNYVGRTLIGSQAEGASRYTFRVKVDAGREPTVSPADIRGFSITGQVLDGQAVITPFQMQGERRSTTWLVEAQALGKSGDIATAVKGLTDLELASTHVGSLIGQASKTIESGIGDQPLGLVLPDQPLAPQGPLSNIFAR